MTERIRIVGSELQRGGERIRLRGANIGNWLNLENFMLGLPGVDRSIRAGIRQRWGQELAKEFWRRYEDAYFSEEDAAWMAAQGFNLLRLPFSQMRFEEEGGDDRAFAPIDRAIAACHKHGIAVLLDLHAVAGGQSEDWHADNPNVAALFWEEAAWRERAAALWGRIAARYKDETAVFGYDLLNEPNTLNHGLLNAFYADCLRRIRLVDSDRPVVVEGSRWSDDIASLDDRLFDDKAVMASFHHYPAYGAKTWPTVIAGKTADRNWLIESMANKLAHHAKIRRPMLLGEFGWNAWAEGVGGYDVVRDLLSIADEKGWHWSHWSLKDVGRMGLLAPAQGQAWSKFCGRRLQEHGDHSQLLEGMIAGWSEGRKVDAVRRTIYAKKLGQVGEDLLLNAMLDELAEQFEGSALLKLTESFRFANCLPNAAGVAALV